MCVRVDVFVDIRLFGANTRRSRTHQLIPKFRMLKFTVSRKYERRKNIFFFATIFLSTHGSTGRIGSINLFCFCSVCFSSSNNSQFLRKVCAWEYPLIRQMEEWRQHDLFYFSWNPFSSTKIFGQIERRRRTQQINSTRLVSVTQSTRNATQKKEILTSISDVLWISDQLIVCWFGRECVR